MSVKPTGQTQPAKEVYYTETARSPDETQKVLDGYSKANGKSELIKPFPQKICGLWGSDEPTAQDLANNLRQKDKESLTENDIQGFLDKKPDPDLLLSTFFPLLIAEDKVPQKVREKIYNHIIDKPELAPGLAQRLKNPNYRTLAGCALKDMSGLKNHSESALALIQIQTEEFNGSFTRLGMYNQNSTFGPGWHTAVNETLTKIGLPSNQDVINWLRNVAENQHETQDTRDKARVLCNKLESRYPS